MTSPAQAPEPVAPEATALIASSATDIDHRDHEAGAVNLDANSKHFRILRGLGIACVVLSVLDLGFGLADLGCVSFTPFSPFRKLWND
jgi:hypothetical protein